MSEWTGTWCSQCGPDVTYDEDGCCCTCGANCVGDGAEQALALRAENERLRGEMTAQRVLVRRYTGEASQAWERARAWKAAARRWRERALGLPVSTK